MMAAQWNPLIIKITLLLMISLIVDFCLRRRFVLQLSACWNAALLSIVALPLAAMMVPPLSLPLWPAATAPSQAKNVSPSLVTIPDSAQASGEPDRPANSIRSRMFVPEFAMILRVIYFMGSAILLMRLLVGFRAINALCERALPVTDGAWIQRFEYWSERLSPGKRRSGLPFKFLPLARSRRANRQSRAVLLESDRVQVPLALGILQPTIIIPARMIAGMTSKNIDAILTHELAHLRRSDCTWQLLQRFVEAACWFHPLVWFAGRRIAFIRERACDDFAVSLVGDVQAYGMLLVEIAAGMRGRKSLGLGMAITRSNSLARRVSAMADGTGCGRCVASAGFRYLLTGAAVCGSAGLASVVVGRASAQAAVAETGAEQDQAVAADPVLTRVAGIQSPELIGVTWQQIPESNTERIQQPVWRPDGTHLTDVEANKLLDEAEGFQAHWWNVKNDLRPLVLLFRENGVISGGLMTGVVMPDTKPMWTGSWGFMTSSGLKKSAISPPRRLLSQWPAKIDIQIKVPLENRVLIKTLSSITEERVHVGPGVQWYIDPQRGMDFSKPNEPRSGLTAAVLEIRNGRLENLTEFSAKVSIKGEERTLEEGYVTVIEPQPGVQSTIRVSRSIADTTTIDKVEFFRQRFRMDQIRNVETHLDLLPPDNP